MTARQLVGPTSVCRTCHQPIVWAVTVASDRGPGGRPIALEPTPNPAGRIAARSTGARLLARPLARDEGADRDTEQLAMPHAAVCQPVLLFPSSDPTPDELAERRRQRRLKAGRRGWVAP